MTYSPRIAIPSAFKVPKNEAVSRPEVQAGIAAPDQRDCPAFRYCEAMSYEDSSETLRQTCCSFALRLIRAAIRFIRANQTERE